MWLWCSDQKFIEDRWSFILILVKQKDRLEIEWKELRLDLSELSSGMSLEKEANEKASMQLPDSSKIKVLLINEDKQ